MAEAIRHAYEKIGQAARSWGVKPHQLLAYRILKELEDELQNTTLPHAKIKEIYNNLNGNNSTEKSN